MISLKQPNSSKTLEIVIDKENDLMKTTIKDGEKILATVDIPSQDWGLAFFKLAQIELQGQQKMMEEMMGGMKK